MERSNRLGPARPHRQVQHADGVPAAGKHHNERPGAGEEAPGLDPLQQLVADHAAQATKSSVGVGKPLRLTRPIPFSSTRSLPAIDPATASVTSTSPASARLTTRWARLTWPPQ